MDRSWRRGTAVLTTVAVVAFMAVACAKSRPPHPSGGLAIVAGGRANMPRLALTASAMKMHDDAVLSSDELFVVGVSGDPQVLYDEKIENNCDDPTTCGAVVRQYQSQTAQLLAATAAKTPEADTLGAIMLAARSLTAVQGNGPRRILVIDNGLQTAGDMQLQGPGALAVDPAAAAKDLSASDKLRDLRGTEVLFTGLGSRVDPQGKLSSNTLSRLEKLWRSVLEAGGARVTIDPAPLPEESASGKPFPKVTVVPDGDQVTDPGTGCFRIRADQVGFQPDKPDLVDENAARKVLEPIAEELKRKNVKVTVIGTTAYPETDSVHNPLSHARAETVVRILESLGVNRSLLIADGVGTQFAGYVNPAQGGTANEFIAVRMRLVIISPVGGSCPA